MNIGQRVQIKTTHGAVLLGIIAEGKSPKHPDYPHVHRVSLDKFPELGYINVPDRLLSEYTDGDPLPPPGPAFVPTFIPIPVPEPTTEPTPFHFEDKASAVEVTEKLPLTSLSLVGKVSEKSSPKIVDNSIYELADKVVAFVDANGPVGKGEIVSELTINTSTWVEVVNILLAEGRLVRTGEKRGTKYHTKNAVGVAVDPTVASVIEPEPVSVADDPTPVAQANSLPDIGNKVGELAVLSVTSGNHTFNITVKRVNLISPLYAVVSPEGKKVTKHVTIYSSATNLDQFVASLHSHGLTFNEVV